MNKREIGNYGEKIALEYLKNQNYIILDKNYYKNHGEIDLIAKDSQTIIFVEVKLRNSLKYGHPLESINHKKINKLRETASYFLEENNLFNIDVRFDVVSILLENRTYLVEHIKNAF